MKRTVLIAAGALCLLTAGLAFLSRTPQAPAPKPPAASDAFEVGIPTAQEVRNMLAVYGERVETTERELTAVRQQLKEMEQRLETARRKEVSALEKLIRGLGSSVEDAPSEPSRTARLRTLPFDPPEARTLRLPAGSFGEATLLTGAFAPVSGQPLPVLLRLDAALVGPQSSRVPIRGALLVGKAQGEANSRRAVIQLETLSLVGSDGKALETQVNGWAVDNDGIQGIEGHYVWHAEEIMALAATAGALSGGADAMARQETTVQATPLGGLQGTVTGDPFRFAGYRALSSGFERLGDAISKRLDEIAPAIYVPNARRVTVVFVNGVTLKGHEVPETPESPYEGLDREEW